MTERTRTGRRTRLGDSRFVRYWLAPLILLLVGGGIAGGLATFANSWWAHPDRPPSAEQRAPDNSSLFTGPGVEYASATGVLIVRIGADSLPASELGLDDDGTREIDPAIPLQVRVLGEDAAFVFDSAEYARVTTEGGRVTRVEMAPWGTATFPEVMAVLERHADTVGWTPEDLAAFQTPVADGDSLVYELPGATRIGATVSARMTVDRGAMAAQLVLVVER